MISKFKNKALLFSCLLSISFLYACKEDFLDVDPQGRTRSEDFFVTQEHALQAVNAIYGNLREYKVSAFPHLVLTHVTSDNAEKGSDPGDASFVNDYDNFTFTSTQFFLADYWSGQYQGINLANQAISNIPGISMDASLQQRLIAEAKFLRALHYFNLVRAYGGVPLLTRPPVEVEEINPVRATKEEVYAQIIQDLTEASSVLPANYDALNKGRATLGAALSLLAKVQMYQRNWPEVLRLTNEVMGMGYALTPEFNQVFRIASENNSESIFEVQAQTLPGNCGASNSQWAEVQGVRGQFGWGFAIPTEDLVNAFEPGDQRLEATVLFRGEVTPEGDKINDNAPNPRYSQKAYVPSSVTRDCGYGKDQNIRLIRFAEVLLMHAEAANELGQTSEALNSLNRVRNRAGLGNVETTDQTALRNAIWQERRLELALEGDRFYDLVRQGRAAEVLQAQGKQFKAGVNEVFAIPQTQIDLSGGTLTQNPGY